MRQTLYLQACSNTATLGRNHAKDCSCSYSKLQVQITGCETRQQLNKPVTTMAIILFWSFLVMDALLFRFNSLIVSVQKKIGSFLLAPPPPCKKFASFPAPCFLGLLQMVDVVFLSDLDRMLFFLFCALSCL